MSQRSVKLSIQSWPTKTPFVITGHTFTCAEVLFVEITEGPFVGRGEGAGIYYKNETGSSLLSQANTVIHQLEEGIDRTELQSLLPIGGARNAIDCALWDLEAKKQDKTIWSLVDIDPRDIITVNTVGIDTPENMANNAASLDSPIIKVKLDGENPLECMQAIRGSLPKAEIIVDVNQGWSFEQLVAMAPEFKQLNVAMIEQPLPRGEDQQLAGYNGPIPLCADESCLDTSDLDDAEGRYQFINIKLDKTGGLTEGLKLARAAQRRGFSLMVGNMLGTSLAMAPAFVIAQLCEWVDIDGPILLSSDRDNAMAYNKGRVTLPTAELWG